MEIALHGASQLKLQAESGGVHVIAAAGARSITIRSARGTKPRAGVSRSGRSAITIVLSGHAAVHLPFVQGTGTSADYEVIYPANLRLDVSDLSGTVTIDGNRAPAAVETNSGSIVANGAHGALDLAADSGNVTVTLAPDWRAGSLRMQSGGGTLRLSVPTGFRAHVDASTGEGQLADALTRTAASAKYPFVWLYTVKGDVFITTAPK